MSTDASACNVCRFCGGATVLELPVPHPEQSMLSDGRIIMRSLRKVSCVGCGLVSHATPPEQSDVRRFYDGHYDLGVTSGAEDIARAERYARCIAWVADDRRIERVLEVGCGAGHTLSALQAHWPQAMLLGLEPAPQLVKLGARRTDRLLIRECFLEDLPQALHGFDLIYAINVLEHAVDPIGFITQAAKQLTANGRIVLICPAAMPVNFELMFLDHIHTFGRPAFELLAELCGLKIAAHAPEGIGAGDFQMVVLAPAALSPSSGARHGPMAEDQRDIANQRGRYLTLWASLDEVLMERSRSAHRLGLFGAGEVAALVRCYAPAVWRRVEALIVHDPTGARDLGRTVLSYAEFGSATAVDTLIVATHPRSQATVAARLIADGHNVIRFDDLVPC